MITTHGFSGNIEDLVDQYMRLIGAEGSANVIDAREYYKRPGHQVVLFEVEEYPDFAEAVRLTGSAPVLHSESLAIFDTAQGSRVLLDQVYWMYVEIDESAT